MEASLHTYRQPRRRARVPRSSSHRPRAPRGRRARGWPAMGAPSYSPPWARPPCCPTATAEREGRGRAGPGLAARARQVSREARGLMGSAVPPLSGGPRPPSPAPLNPVAPTIPIAIPGTAGGHLPRHPALGVGPRGVGGGGVGCDSRCLGDRAPLTGAVRRAGSFASSSVC